MEKCKISIITVVYNGERNIEKTIQSVISQKYNSYEYIVIDGCSNDATMDIVNKYQGSIDIIISENDSGIYDAMNKGIRIASGEYIYFLNSGDSFNSNDTLETVLKYLESGKDMYYGRVKRNELIESYKRRLSLFSLIYMERMICHQAIFLKTSIASTHLFDTSYKICGDRDQLIRCVCDRISYEYMNEIVIADYDTNGISANYSLYSNESLKIANKYKGQLAFFFGKPKRTVGKLLRIHKQ